MTDTHGIGVTGWLYALAQLYFWGKVAGGAVEFAVGRLLWRGSRL